LLTGVLKWSSCHLVEHDLAAENEALRKDIEILQHEVEVLSAKVAELEARSGTEFAELLAASLLGLAQEPERNDGPPNARRPRQRVPRQSVPAVSKPAPPGGDPRKSAASDPDEVVVHEPERCDSCGNDLTKRPARGRNEPPGLRHS